MSSFAYVAVDPSGGETRGTLEVSDQIEAVRRIKQMGLFPTQVFSQSRMRERRAYTGTKRRGGLFIRRHVPLSTLTVFTRQTATLLKAGMPLLRGLRILRDQEENRTLQWVVDDVATRIEAGSSLTEAVEAHPKVFNGLFLNMVRAGEIGGALELTLCRLAEFMEKSRKIRGKVTAAMFYPCAVLLVAFGILVLLMAFVVPRFQQVFDGLLQGRSMPAFTVFVMSISTFFKHHFLEIFIGAAVLFGTGMLTARTKWGRYILDQFKITAPGIGPVFRKLAISRFARTLGTLIGSGVPILQALTISRETAGNVVVGKVIQTIHNRVKEGDPMAPTLKESGIFPPLVAGMVDVGEQTGAIPEMLLRIADTYDDDVDNAASAMTSLLEPVMIVFLAVIVGSIVVAMFLPLIRIMTDLTPGSGAEDTH
jgi:type IV pilus assembly protein PilC